MMPRLLLLLLTASITLSGCATFRERPVILHPIETTDIMSVPAGSTISHPNGYGIKVEKDGWFLSDYYVEAVAKARVQ